MNQSMGELFAEGVRVGRAANLEGGTAGHRRVELEDLLVGLVLAGGPAAGTLLSLGLDARRLRRAVARVHRTRVGSLGVEVPDDRSMPDSWPADLEQSDAVMAVFAAVDDHLADDRRLLLALVDEPSGLIEETLAELGTSADEVRAAADEYEPPEVGDAFTVTWELAAAPGEVWALVSDPSRWSEWHQEVERVDVHDDGFTVWQARTPARTGLGRLMNRATRSLAEAPTHYRVVDPVPGERIEWERTRDRGDARRVSLSLEERDARTRLTMSQPPTGDEGRAERAVLPTMLALDGVAIAFALSLR